VPAPARTGPARPAYGADVMASAPGVTAWLRAGRLVVSRQRQPASPSSFASRVTPSTRSSSASA
jgi:hypothetical protein